MKEKLRDQYDSLYTAQDDVFGGGQPVEAVCQIKNYIDSGRVLDIGGGEGRNALYLAERGFRVSVNDLSKVGLDKIKLIAKEKGFTIDTHVADVTEDKIKDDYEVILLTFVLHHMDKLEAVKVIKEAQKHTVIGGINVIETFVNKGGLYERNKVTGRFYPCQKEIEELYKDWDIKELSIKEIMTMARNKEGKPMKNHAVSLLAQKC